MARSINRNSHTHADIVVQLGLCLKSVYLRRVKQALQGVYILLVVSSTLHNHRTESIQAGPDLSSKQFLDLLLCHQIAKGLRLFAGCWIRSNGMQYQA